MSWRDHEWLVEKVQGLRRDFVQLSLRSDVEVAKTVENVEEMLEFMDVIQKLREHVDSTQRGRIETALLSFADDASPATYKAVIQAVIAGLTEVIDSGAWIHK